MRQVTFSVQETAEKILRGKKLILAGDGKLLRSLPDGHWIGGTIPYFMSEKGGMMSRDRIFVTELPDYVKKLTIRTYSESTIRNIYRDAPEHGFSVIILPASSAIHFNFSLNAPGFEGFATSPLIGWIAGVHVDDIGREKPLVFFGDKQRIMENGAVVMHAWLPENKYAEINIINIFTQGDGDEIMFPEDGFSTREAIINGKPSVFADYIKEKDLDTRLPLVADYSGAMINTSFQRIDEESGIVHFYAPVFHSIRYRHAAPVGDYVEQFTSQMPGDDSGNTLFSCNCILNYLYSELEGRKTGDVTGPITFGEVAYQLLNQTLAYLAINEIDN